MEIRSIQNTRIKNLLRLQSSRRQRQRTDVMLVEGLDEIRLAISAGHVPRTLVTAPALARDMLGEVPAEVVTVSRAVFEKLSYREHPDGWLAVFSTPQVSLEQLQLGHNPLLIAMEALEKPGNLGAILRTADAAAVDAVLVCDRRADIYSPNVVRASRRALFSVPIVETSSGA